MPTRLHFDLAPSTVKATSSEFQIEIPPLRTSKAVQKNSNPFLTNPSLTHAVYKSAPATSQQIHTDIPAAPGVVRLTLTHPSAAGPMHVADQRSLDKQQAEDLNIFRASQRQYFLQQPVPRSLGWPQRSRDLSVAEVLEGFGAENLQQLILYKKAGMTGRKTDGTPINGYGGDIDHLLAYLNVVNDNATVMATKNFPGNLFRNSETPGYPNFLVHEILKLFDAKVNDLSKIQNDQVVAIHPLGGTVLSEEMFDIPQLRQSLKTLRDEITPKRVKQFPQVLKNFGDDRTADIFSRAQSASSPIKK